MPQFTFTVLDAQGRQSTGTTQAVDRESAMRYLAKTHATVLGLEEVRPRRLMFERGVSGDEVLVLTQQMASMLRAGLTLGHALGVLMVDMENPTFRRIISAVATGLSEGRPLSQMLAEHPAVFPRLYVYMVQAGEAGGSLPEILRQLAIYLEQAESLKRRVKSALYYPLFILIVAGLISAFIFVFGVRQFQEIYEGFNAPLPALTRVVMAAGGLVWDWWWAILLALVVAGVAFVRGVSTDRGALWLDGVLLRIPVLGPLLRRVAISRFARTLSSLYAGGVPLVQALELTAGSMGNRVLEAVVLRVVQNVKEGESISGPLRDSGIFTPMSISMIASGEESGSLEVMLAEVADFYDSQIDAMLRGMVSLVEPAVILCVGVFVAVLILALGLPMLNLVEILGQ